MITFFDTNAAIQLINAERAMRSRFRRLIANAGSPAISTVVLFELWYGIANGKRWDENTEALRAFLASPIEVVPFGAGDAQTAGEIRATLKAAGTPIGPYDLLIAAHAVRAGATLVTANTREFSRVPGLTLEDWSR